jgi:hypothetical protein
VIGGGRELEEDVVVGQREVLLVGQLALELTHDVRVGPQEGAPRAEARVVARDRSRRLDGRPGHEALHWYVSGSCIRNQLRI